LYCVPVYWTMFMSATILKHLFQSFESMPMEFKSAGVAIKKGASDVPLPPLYVPDMANDDKIITITNANLKFFIASSINKDFNLA
jgi:hypothetical protein